MLSDEEKKAIETIKDFKNLKWYEHAFDNGTEVLDEEQKQDIKIILNLIEKQQKEIEELNILLKQQAKDIGYMILNYTSNDKIKATIEKYEEKFKAENGKKTINYHLYRIIIDEVLKPLLKEE